ncbi:MAG: ATP-binding protein [Nitrospirae bacterium]|nr:ATP-binding protein [Nitrospirota bacterium]
MINRNAHNALKRLARGFPVVTLTGPRQSGKTTLAKMAFPTKPYISLEDPDIRSMAEEDPRGLLSKFPDGAVLDEVQRAPHLFSYLQTHIDADMRPGMFVLTGSQQFGLLSGISQSLAGRVGMVQLLPFSISELKAAKRLPATLDELLFRGLYPPIYDRDIMPGDWFAGYMTTYIERDVRQLINVRDISTFQRFLKMCAARIGQLLNLSSLAADCGITHNTASAWISVLEASYIVCLLRPHHRNFNKRLVKSPKLYFVDAGFAAWLLGIREAEYISFHAQRGALFENLVITEFIKECFNQGRQSNLFFWRDSKGLGIDLILEEGDNLKPVEIKSGQTIVPEFLTGLQKWSVLSGNPKRPAMLIYGGERELTKGNIAIMPWKKLP